MLLIMSWIASCDGSVDEDELRGLREIAASGQDDAQLSAVIEIARSGTIEDLQLACEVLSRVEPQHRVLMLQMTIGMALEDGVLTTAEGHILRLVCDVLSLTPSDLDNLFREMTGAPFPPPTDLSSAAWWESRSTRQSNRAAGSTHGQTRTSTDRCETPSTSRLRDLGVLGLDEHATIDEIREAYRRMAMVHHPDKFVALGPEAVKAAEITFCRIRASYERLVTS